MIKYDSSKTKLWFTSDTHFGHHNIIRFCNRPWVEEEMNEGLIKKWNSIVSKNDIVYHLGDFAFCNHATYKDILSRLNGEIHLIRGNHDRTRSPRQNILDMFASVQDQLQIDIDGIKVYLNHYPFLCWGGMYREENPTIQLHGHIHSGPNSTSRDIDNFIFHPLQYDVGVDNNNYQPISWEQIKEKMKL